MDAFFNIDELAISWHIIWLPLVFARHVPIEIQNGNDLMACSWRDAILEQTRGIRQTFTHCACAHFCLSETSPVNPNTIETRHLELDFHFRGCIKIYQKHCTMGFLMWREGGKICSSKNKKTTLKNREKKTGQKTTLNLYEHREHMLTVSKLKQEKIQKWK